MAGRGWRVDTQIYTGRFVRGFALKCGICSSVRAELLAALRGLLMARDLVIPCLILEVDYEVVVNSLRVEPEAHNLNFFLILYCRALLHRSDLEVIVNHTYREANEVADWLANESFNCLEKNTFFYHLPVEMQSILFTDNIGCTQLRLILE